MTDEEARAALEALVRDRREDYAGLSRLLGRNPAYVQQYVKRGSPRRLAERDRRTLAAYFEVAEAALGGPAAPAAGEDALVAIPRLALRASAGPGALPEERRVGGRIGFPPGYLRALGVGRPEAASLIRVWGDSMAPTLLDGDDILLDRDDAAERLRDGIYVLRVDEALIVKRVALAPDGRLAILSDNRDAPAWSDVDRASLSVIGRVVWAGRRLR